MATDPPPGPPDPDSLPAALARHGITLPAGQIALLDRYARLLWEWNEKFNLTRHTDYEKFVSRDLVDSLQLAALLLPGETVLDVGTGGGVPGIVLAIVRPDLQVTLLDSVQKKIRAVSEITAALSLPVETVCARVEEHLEDARYDALVFRAVGPLWELLRWCKPHWNMIGRLLVVKGPKWPEERHEAAHRGLLRALELKLAGEYPLAGTESQSVILKLWPKGRKER
ncbi:MAG TPA: 16S rRNA (guanine(527)-N(7))-methyltransferase RsmG [Pirellulaceae bacterium]|nr:16S rRNA (guanine(527)-N(7))-methyltransferase RsmG [Pirellulaceae bacterium]